MTATACDVLVPCATGGLIDAAVAATVPCSAIAGAANNLLAEPGAARVLRERGIVLAPDYVANAGGAVHLVGREVLGWTSEQVTARTLQIGDTLRGIFADARRNGITSVEAADRAALRTLDAGRASGGGREEDRVDGHLGLRHHGHVGAGDLGDRRAGTLGHAPLGSGRDDPVLGTDDHPAGQRRPSRGA